MDLKEKSIKGVAWSLVESFGIRVFSVATYFILAGILDPAAFGLVALANTYLQFANIFVDQGLSTALVQRENVEEAHLSSAFWGNLAIGSLFAVVSIFSAPFIAQFYKSPELERVIRVASLVFIFGSLGKTHQALLLRKFNFKALAKARIIGIMISGTLGIALAFRGYGVWSLVVQQMVYVLIENLLVCSSARWAPKFLFSWQYYQDILRFGSKVMANNFLNYTNRYTDDLLVGYFLGTHVLGYYSFAYKIYNTVTDLIMLSISKVALPLFSSLQADQEKFRFTYLTANKITAYVAVAAFSLMGLIGPDLVVLVLGNKWLPSTPIIEILSVGGVLLFVHWLTEQSLISLGKLKQSLGFNLLNGIISVVLLTSLVGFGVRAVALAYPIRALLVFPVLVLIIKKYLTIPPGTFLQALSKPYLTALVSSGALLLFAWFYHGDVVVGLFIKCATILVVYGAVIYALEPYIYKTIKSVIFKKASLVNK